MHSYRKQSTRFLFFLTILLLGIFGLPGLQSQDIYDDHNLSWWKLLQGEWTSNDNGNIGVSKFYFDLGKNIIVRENHVDFSARNGQPATVHDDLMIVYPSSSFTKAIYFDNEGHVINYSVLSSSDTLTFISEKMPAAPRFRLKYIKKMPSELRVVFEIAQPATPESFNPYIEGTIYKK